MKKEGGCKGEEEEEEEEKEEMMRGEIGRSLIYGKRISDASRFEEVVLNARGTV